MFTIAQLNTAIANISRAQARASKDIGAVCLMALYFANVDKDAGAANALVKCLRKSTKQAGIVALLETHGNLCYRKKERDFVYFDAGAPSWDESVKGLRVACAAWEDFKVEAVKVTEFDLADALYKLCDKAAKMSKGGVKVEGIALVERITALIAEGALSK